MPKPQPKQKRTDRKPPPSPNKNNMFDIMIKPNTKDKDYINVTFGYKIKE